MLDFTVPVWKRSMAGPCAFKIEVTAVVASCYVRTFLDCMNQ